MFFLLLQKATPKEDEKPMNKVVENGTSDVPETVVQSLPPPPAVDSPTPAPAITEDVASVTKVNCPLNANKWMRKLVMQMRKNRRTSFVMKLFDVFINLMKE